MAEPIAQAFSKRGYLTRMYVPLGELLPGMGYLVRRLLENTSNESFLRHTFFEHSEVENLLKDPAVRDIAQESPLPAIEVPCLSAVIPEGDHHATHEATVACNLEY